MFARQVILVEGIAESIILPSLARHIVLRGDESAIRQVESTSIIAVDGVDFGPYLKLLLGGEFPLADKVVVVTDGDKAGATTPGQDRRTAYEDAHRSAVTAGVLAICVGEYTLEADLFGPPENDPLLRNAWRQIHSSVACRK